MSAEPIITASRRAPRKWTVFPGVDAVMISMTPGTAVHHAASEEVSVPLVFDLTNAVSVLRRTPSVLDVWLRDLPAGWIEAREAGDGWSPFDVVGHLIHGEKTDWMPRVRSILQHGDARAFEKFDRFAQAQASAGRSLAQLLDEFAQLRSQNLTDLGALRLKASDLDRRGRHPELGPVTLRQLLATWVTHDHDHLMQIARVLGTQYAQEVGPWRAYLRVVSSQSG